VKRSIEKIKKIVFHPKNIDKSSKLMYNIQDKKS